MYSFAEELTKEDYDLIEKVYKAVSLKPGLFIHFMNACYGAFNKRVEFAEKRAADAEAVTVSAVCMAGKKATPSMKKLLEELRSAKYNTRLFKEWREAAIEASHKNLRRAHQAEKPNSLLADKLELVCGHLSKDGDCPLFWYCPAKKLGKSCGELTDKDWIEDAEEIVK